MLTEQRRQESAVFPSSIPAEDVYLVELMSLLSELSEQQRMVVILRYVGGYRPGEVAQVLGTSPETVRVQLHRAHEVLRKIVGSHHD